MPPTSAGVLAELLDDRGVEVVDLVRHGGHGNGRRPIPGAAGTVTTMASHGPVLQLRVVVEAEDFDRALAFYRDVLGLPEEAAFEGDGDARVVILDAGRATLELANPAQRRMIDAVEVGRDVSPPIRLAFEVTDATARDRCPGRRRRHGHRRAGRDAVALAERPARRAGRAAADPVRGAGVGDRSSRP